MNKQSHDRQTLDNANDCAKVVKIALVVRDVIERLVNWLDG